MPTLVKIKWEDLAGSFLLPFFFIIIIEEETKAQKS